MSHALHTGLQVMISLLALAVLIWPLVFADDVDLEANDPHHNHIP